MNKARQLTINALPVVVAVAAREIEYSAQQPSSEFYQEKGTLGLGWRMCLQLELSISVSAR
jgi:hypothetical protein